MLRFLFPAKQTTEPESLGLDAAVDQVMALIWFDPQGNVIDANANFCALMGYPVADLIGKNHSTFVDQSYARSDAYADFWEILRSNVVQDGEFMRRNSAGETVWIKASYVPICDDRGDVVRVVKMASDITAIRSATANMSDALQALSHGDLSKRLPQTDLPLFQGINTQFNTTMDRLDELVVAIDGVSRGLETESTDIARNAQNLADRGEQQAATLEETAATLEEISSAVQQTATNAQEASSFAQDAAGNSQNGTQVVSDAISAMREIKEGSGEIGKIIEVIDSISFQTNLLALNAGIEAARAGDAGRGFAVVASEIRALAQRTAEAARDISELIVRSNTTVARGSELVDQTGESLGLISEEVARVVANIQGITQAALEQSEGIAAVNSATGQIDTTTQRNAALADESARSAAKLANGATKLREMISFFQINQDATAAFDDAPVETELVFRRSA